MDSNESSEASSHRRGHPNKHSHTSVSPPTWTPSVGRATQRDADVDQQGRRDAFYTSRGHRPWRAQGSFSLPRLRSALWRRAGRPWCLTRRRSATARALSGRAAPIGLAQIRDNNRESRRRGEVLQRQVAVNAPLPDACAGALAGACDRPSRQPRTASSCSVDGTRGGFAIQRAVGTTADVCRDRLRRILGHQDGPEWLSAFHCRRRADWPAGRHGVPLAIYGVCAQARGVQASSSTAQRRDGRTCDPHSMVSASLPLPLALTLRAWP